MLSCLLNFNCYVYNIDTFTKKFKKSTNFFFMAIKNGIPRPFYYRVRRMPASLRSERALTYGRTSSRSAELKQASLCSRLFGAFHDWFLFYLLHGNLWHQPQIFHDGAEGESVELDEPVVRTPCFCEVLVSSGVGTEISITVPFPENSSTTIII